MDLFDRLAGLPFSFFLCFATISMLAGEALFKHRTDWAIPSLVAYATVGAWYLMEPVYLPEGVVRFSSDVLDDALLQVTGFLLIFRVALPMFTHGAPARSQFRADSVAEIPAESYFVWLSIAWACLVAVGIYRMGGDVLAALLPTGSRWSGRMWSRASAGDAGSTGFLVSFAGYLYTLICASFGILLPFFRRASARLAAMLIIGISWPYFLLEGSRNIFLAVFLPGAASYLLYSRHSATIKTMVCAASFLAIDIWFRIELSFRNVGLGHAFNAGDSTVVRSKHEGLNMLSELCYINSFYDSGLLNLSWGGRYLQELVNFIPRAIWPDKPLLGIDYAILRGFGSTSGGLGVYATISTGLIGQGVTNFGPLFGPIAAALLFALWIAILVRLRRREDSVLRLTLFLVGLGLTFNLGRDLSLLVIWPFVIGYFLVRGIEWYHRGNASPAPITIHNRS